jgi:hypothetical protein
MTLQPVKVPQVKAYAMLARAEQMIDVLRSCYVSEGWKLDDEAAERTLRYFRRVAADPSLLALSPGADDADEEWHALMTFFSDHNQSLDWVFRGDPRGMICGVAAVSARGAADQDAGVRS